MVLGAQAGRLMGSAALLMSISLVAPAAMGRSTDRAPLYQDAKQPVAARVRDLLGRMTLAEKVGQMTLISVQDLIGDCTGTFGPPEPNPDCLRTFLGNGL